MKADGRYFGSIWVPNEYRGLRVNSEDDWRTWENIISKMLALYDLSYPMFCEAFDALKKEEEGEKR